MLKGICRLFSFAFFFVGAIGLSVKFHVWSLPKREEDPVKVAFETHDLNVCEEPDIVFDEAATVVWVDKSLEEELGDLCQRDIAVADTPLDVN